ncbi:sugar kinase [Mesorhizobium sp.]|uniref:tagatose kinase n=1 Tax=Mesorhizobium sp. TaxID=1871066 RepID=UPI000FE74F19|nr:sugar kinase [Mesorhizobium sp.]RWA69140.1 MAG: sugar kinase [Mesorhizobium sp.]RWA85789.1 MAG: sugar kinase [Mesorhizobium sp.]RWD97931.1 MAG: sugar kinase [Mesorhizobium sp.]
MDEPSKTLATDSLGPTVTVGEILVEIVATKIGVGFREPVELLGPFPSGAPAIFVDQCGRIGGSAALIGAVGSDDFGFVNIERLKRDGVDVSAIAVSPDYPTGSAFVRYRTDGSRDFVYNIGTSAAARFSWTEKVEALVTRSGHLHVMGSALSMPSAWTVIEKAAQVIKARGGTLSLDPNLRKELKYDDQTEARFAQLVAMSNLLLPSGDELERAAGVEGEAASIARLFELGVGEIVLKRGREGASCFLQDGTRVDAAAFDVKEIDPTGAGDCFGGAYIACRRLGMPVEQALLYGCAAGARNVTVRGPMEGAGTRAELDHFIRTTKRLT